MTSKLRRWSEPQSVPRGLLRFYLLRLLSKGPAHGYELIKTIEEKTEGAWRPGAGSVYPLLRGLVREGCIESLKDRDGRRAYRITAQGLQVIGETEHHFEDFGRRWSSARNLFTDLLKPEVVGKLSLDSTRATLEVLHDLCDSEKTRLPPEEAWYLLRETQLLLEHELSWTNQELRNVKIKQKDE